MRCLYRSIKNCYYWFVKWNHKTMSQIVWPWYIHDHACKKDNKDIVFEFTLLTKCLFVFVADEKEQPSPQEGSRHPPAAHQPLNGMPPTFPFYPSLLLPYPGLWPSKEWPSPPLPGINRHPALDCNYLNPLLAAPKGKNKWLKPHINMYRWMRGLWLKLLLIICWGLYPTSSLSP